MAEIAGHRGAAGLAPENSIASFRLAYGFGVRLLELDLRLTGDGVPVVIHDATLDRTTLGQGRVGSLPLTEVQAWPMRGTDREPERVPTLASALESVPADARWLIELKPDAGREGPLVQAALDTVRHLAAEGRVRLISFDRGILACAREAAPAIPRGVLEARQPGPALADAARLDCGSLLLHHERVTPEVAAAAQDAGLSLAAWTANSEAVVRRLIELGTAEIISDFPDMALRVCGGG